MNGNKEKDVRHQGERQFQPSPWLIRTARNAAEKASSTKEGSFFESLTAILFSAFALEAYLNESLSRLLNRHTYEAVERLSFKKKIAFLRTELGLPNNWGEAPLKRLSSLVNIRNNWVHGKPEILTIDVILPSGESLSSEHIDSDMETVCTPKEALAYVSSVEAFCDECFNSNPEKLSQLGMHAATVTIGSPVSMEDTSGDA